MWPSITAPQICSGHVPSPGTGLLQGTKLFTPSETRPTTKPEPQPSSTFKIPCHPGPMGHQALCPGCEPPGVHCLPTGLKPSSGRCWHQPSHMEAAVLSSTSRDMPPSPQGHLPWPPTPVTPSPRNLGFRCGLGICQDFLSTCHLPYGLWHSVP